MRTFEFTGREVYLLQEAVEGLLNNYEEWIHDAEDHEDYEAADRLSKEEDEVYELFNRLTESFNKVTQN